MPAWPLNVVAVDGGLISATGAVHPLVPLQVFSQGSAGNMLHATPRSSTDEFSVKLVTVAYDGPMFRS